MTWKEFKDRAEELGVQDNDRIGFDSIDDEGRAVFELSGLVTVKQIPIFAKNKEKP